MAENTTRSEYRRRAVTGHGATRYRSRAKNSDQGAGDGGRRTTRQPTLLLRLFGWLLLR